jgi:hypothetical protein
MKLKGDPPLITSRSSGGGNYSPKMPSSPTTRTATLTIPPPLRVGASGARSAFVGGSDSPHNQNNGASSPHFSFAPSPPPPPPAPLGFRTRSEPPPPLESKPLLTPSQMLAEADIIYEVCMSGTLILSIFMKKFLIVDAWVDEWIH